MTNTSNCVRSLMTLAGDGTMQELVSFVLVGSMRSSDGDADGSFDRRHQR